MFLGMLGRTCDPATQFFNTEAQAWWDDTAMCTPATSKQTSGNPACKSPYYRYSNPDGSFYYYDMSDGGTVCTPAATEGSSTGLMVGMVLLIAMTLLMDSGGRRRR